MYKTKIYASRVTNLSDARYFAAMGVQYLGIPLDADIDINAVKEMFDWVEGPEFIGEITGLQTIPNLKEIISQLSLTKISINPFYPGNIEEDVSIVREVLFEDYTGTEEEIVLKIDEPILKMDAQKKTKLIHLIESNRVWLQIEEKPEDLIGIIENFKPFGIQLLGGEEEKVGFKSFDEIDLIFEHLEV